MVNLMESYFSCTKGHISDLVTFELRPEPTIQRVRDLLSNWLGTAGAKTLKQQSLAVGALGGQFHLVVSCCDSSPRRAEARWAAKGAGAGVLDERESLWLTHHGGLKVQGLHLSVR